MKRTQLISTTKFTSSVTTNTTTKRTSHYNNKIDSFKMKKKRAPCLPKPQNPITIGVVVELESYMEVQEETLEVQGESVCVYIPTRERLPFDKLLKWRYCPLDVFLWAYF